MGTEDTYDATTAFRGRYSVIGQDVDIHPDAKIWNLVYIGDRVKIGANVLVGSLAHISANVVIGDGTLIEGGAHISQYAVIGKNCFIGPNAMTVNDPFPPVRRTTGQAAWSGVRIEDEAIIGAGAIIKPGVVVGRRAVVGMGSVVLEDVPPETVMVGVPARAIYSREEYDRRQEEWAAQGAVTEGR